MTSTSENSHVEMRAFPIPIQKEGQITIPQSVQNNLNFNEGDMLTLLQVGDLVLLTPKQMQIPQLADKITAIREDKGVSLSDLLEGIETEREAIWQEQQQNASNFCAE
ncbi:MAG: AbrB/MazE/SpoVT family DNA-binding domain-containing protein [Calothrix sp. MO_192.B10]|nr:AbrB/MazE/SpoVT family DNA-binding domain-containing protein [Calothrix sp. MO_192.B10]